MSSQQPPYPQAGPSTNPYYPPPPLPYGYVPNPYAYYAPPPPDMTGPPPHSPGRIHGRGGYRGGAPGYQRYSSQTHGQHLPHQHQHQHPPPYLPVPQQGRVPHYQHKYPHPQQVSPIPAPYSPTVAPYPAPNGAPYPHHPHTPIQQNGSPYWAAHNVSQQPLSPLPKQLSMLPPVSSPQTSSPRLFQPVEPTTNPTVTPVAGESSASIPSPLSGNEASQAASAPNQPGIGPEDAVMQPDPPPPSEPDIEAAPPPPEAEDAPEAQPSPPPPGSPDVPDSPQQNHVQLRSTLPAADEQSPNPDIGGWVLWSRRPTDPTSAPGIIISPRARPPPVVVEKALTSRTPPLTPVVAEAPQFRTAHAIQGPALAQDDVLTDVNTTVVPVRGKFTPKDASPNLPSSSATETEATATTPASPVSTATSVSQAPAAQSKDISDPAAPSAQTSENDSPPKLSETPAAPDPSSGISTPAPAAAPPKPKPSSWASLLRPAADASGNRRPGTLPTSSVVGFSIPASALSSSGSAHGSPSSSPYAAHKPALLALLNGNAYGPPSPPRIRPRGLINTGNMCFANAVLQVLVYCPPFWRLFRELGKYLPTTVAFDGPVVGKEREKEKDEKKSPVPLVEATVQFLSEFVPAEDKEGHGKDKDRGREGGKGKKSGKGREVSMDGEDEDWAMDSFIPSTVYDVVRATKRFGGMTGGHQEDAEEFFGFYLDTLEEELLSILHSIAPELNAAASPAVPDEPRDVAGSSQHEDGWLEVGKKNRSVVTRTTKSTESPITRLFGGKFRSTLRAPHQKDSVIVEDWRELQLDISREQVHTIADALAHLSHPQPVQIALPTRPGYVVDATQHVLIDALPPILVLHLKRFLYDTKVGDVVKIGKKVALEPELVIPADIIAPTRRAGPPARYKLFSVVYHHGLSASGGHYTLDVLHPNRDLSTKPREAWIRIDDELVSDIRPEDVFGGQERDDRCAYLLFYRKVSGGPRT